MGIIIGLTIGAVFIRDKIITVKELDDPETDKLMNLLDLAEGDRDAI